MTGNPDLTDRVILITGAGDGIGKAAALTFARHGATAILLGRTEEKLNLVYDEIERLGGPQPAIFVMDLNTATQEDMDGLANALTLEFGRLDGLLHNAAELGHLAPLTHYNASDWEEVMRVNLMAPYHLTCACLPLLEQSEDASIVFTTADVGRKGRAYWGAYAISMFAVEGMMQTWADELESYSIRVNSIAPNFVRTLFRAKAYPGEDPEELADPLEVMDTYLYLLGPESKGVTGQAFTAERKPD